MQVIREGVARAGQWDVSWARGRAACPGADGAGIVLPEPSLINQPN